MFVKKSDSITSEENNEINYRCSRKQHSLIIARIGDWFSLKMDFFSSETYQTIIKRETYYVYFVYFQRFRNFAPKKKKKKQEEEEEEEI